MKVAVIGSTGGSGRAAVEHLLLADHDVTAFSRRADAVETRSDRLHFVNGDVMNAADVERAVEGSDAVIVTLGIRENPLRVRLRGAARTALDVRSAGTRNVIAAMKKHGVRKLVVQTSYGVGETRGMLRLADKLFFQLILKPQIADTEKQNQDVTASDLDWVIVQPVHLTDGSDDDMPFVSTDGETGQMKVSRKSVGRFLAHAAERPTFVRRSVAVSGVLASRGAPSPASKDGARTPRTEEGTQVA
jgi:putative NADH-flavin reductase